MKDTKIPPSRTGSESGVRSPIADPLLALAVLAGPVGVVAWWAITGGPLDQMAPVGAWPAFLLIAVYPLLEEFVFRGLLQGYLLEKAWARRRAGPVTAANAVTAIVFALSHWPRGGVLLTFGVLGPGLIFGYFRERHGGLATPVLLHAWYNACIVIAAWIGRPVA